MLNKLKRLLSRHNSKYCILYLKTTFENNTAKIIIQKQFISKIFVFNSCRDKACFVARQNG
jgi:hypothetical protein